MLKEKQYKVRKATNGKSAIEAIRLNPPDLILLDIMMPDMNGYQVCETLKSDPKTKDIPIIFISALSEIFDKVKAFELGGADYITKPFQEEEVLSRINSHLMIRSQNKLLRHEKDRLKQEISKRIETEAVLYQSRALISSILTNSLDVIAALEAVREPRTGQIKDFRCLLTNPPIAEIFNREPEDLKVNLYQIDFSKGIIEGSKDFNVEHNIVASPCQTCVNEQIKQVNDLIDSGKTDGIIIIVTDSIRLVPVLEKAIKKGIPVIAVDTALNSESLLTFLAFDNFIATKTMGEWVSQQLGNKGKVLILNGFLDHQNAVDRLGGFLTGFQIGDIEILDAQSADWKKEKGKLITSQWLKKIVC